MGENLFVRSFVHSFGGKRELKKEAEVEGESDGGLVMLVCFWERGRADYYWVPPFYDIVLTPLFFLQQARFEVRKSMAKVRSEAKEASSSS